MFNLNTQFWWTLSCHSLTRQAPYHCFTLTEKLPEQNTMFYRKISFKKLFYVASSLLHKKNITASMILFCQVLTSLKGYLKVAQYVEMFLKLNCY